VTDSTLPNLRTLPRAARAQPPVDRLNSVGESRTLVLDGTRYFAVPLSTSRETAGPFLLMLYPETSWRQAQWEAATPPLALGVGTLCLVVAVTSWIAHRFSRRIGDLERQVARIASGDFQAFEPGPPGDEIQELAGSIQRMCNQLKQMQLTIRQSERTRLLAQLAAGLAHQLRNALTGARMSVQLHARRFPPAEGDETLSVALRQLAMTEEQVQGLLSLGRVERQPHAPCDVERLLEDVAFLVMPSCHHAKVFLRHVQRGEPIRVMADEAGLRAAVLNLTMNAVEAAGSGGEVDLRATSDRTLVTIEVSDTGPGPPPVVAENLLEPFVTSKPEGVGLGLAVAVRVAVEHGGRLSWRRENGQTRFRMTLPHLNGTSPEWR
jgi:signal transduction histidine kinase